MLPHVSQAVSPFDVTCTDWEALPLLGENILPSQIEKLFAEVDTDGSGRIEFPEFCVMVCAPVFAMALL